MEYELTGIEENSFFVGRLLLTNKDDGVTVRWTFDLDIDFKGTDTIGIHLTLSLVVDKPQNHTDLCRLSATHFFRAPQLEGIVHEQDSVNLHSLLPTLVGVSLGTMRGLAYARTQNILGDNFFMPVVNPTALYQHYLPKIADKYKPQSSE